MSTLERKRNSNSTLQRKRKVENRHDKAKGKCWCCRKFIAFLFSHVGLCALVVGYTILGAYVFRHFEAPFEKQRSHNVLSIRNLTIHKLWTETEKLNVLYKENWTAMANLEFEKFQQQLIKAVKDGYDGKEVGKTGQQWSLSGAWIYSLTLISTIGYGNRPRTSEGKVATMVYAMIGIPLMLLFLTNIGNILAKAFKCLYGSCCGCSNGDTSNDNVHLHHNHHAHHHLHDHYHVHHIALNDVSPTGHLLHCNSNSSDPYNNRTNNKCYSGCNSNSVNANSVQRDVYGVTGIESETKLCGDGLVVGDHSCVGTINRAHAHSHPNHSILKNANTNIDNIDVINSPLSNPYHSNHNSMHSQSHPHTHAHEHNITVPTILCLLLILIYLCLGAALFHTWEGWSFIDGSYFCFLTLSTIGFGDLMPSDLVLSGKDGSQKKLIIMSAYIIGGLSLIAMSFNLVHKQVLEKVRKCGRKMGLIIEDEEEEEEVEMISHPHHHDHLDDDFDV